MSPLIINILLSVVFLTIGILATTLLFKSRVQSSIFLAFSAYGATLWILATIVFLNFNNLVISSAAIKTLHFAGVVILTAFTCFAYTFLGADIRRNKSLLFLLICFFVIFSGLLFVTESVVKNAVLPLIGRIIEFGPLYGFYAAYILGMALVSYYYLIKKSRNAQNKVERMQLDYVGIGTIFSLSVGLIFNIVLPFFGYFAFYWLGPFFSVIFVIFTTIAILNYHLFNIKVIAVELLTCAIWIFVLARALLSETSEEMFLNGGLLVFLMVAGVLLIRGVLREVRMREEMEGLAAELEKVNVRLKKLDEAKSEFLSIASHQLRTPLTSIKGLVSMALEDFWGPLNDNQRKYLTQVYDSGERLLKLIENLLDISRIEAGRAEFVFQSIDLKKTAEEIVKELEPQIAKKGLGVSFSAPKMPLFLVKADPLKIRQVAQNFIDNAIKYTREGDIVVRIEREDNMIVFSVTDTGMGISKDDQTTLFTKFQRGKEAVSRRTEGTGLGLYLSAKIIDAHNGKIWATSLGENKGSTFFFSLPALK